VADHVYRRFTRENLFNTTILAQNHVLVQSGSIGWTGNTILGNNQLSLYGGIRSHAPGVDASVFGEGVFGGGVFGASSKPGATIYPLDQVDTQTIDGVIQTPGQYPQTGTLEIVWCTNTSVSQALDETNTRWFDAHHSVIRRTSEWYADHVKRTYPTEADFFNIGVGPQTPSGAFAAVHIPSLFYGRQIASGSVLLSISSFSGSAYSPGSGTLYWRDDGLGRLWEVPTTASDWTSGTHVVGNVLYNEGLVFFTHPSASWHQQLLSGSVSPTSAPYVKIEFDGSYHVKSMIALCRMHSSEVNASNNPTYYYTDETGKRWARNTTDSRGTPTAITYTTAIGIYNEERQLVAVAKLAQPIRKREKDDIDIKLRFDIG
jgi:hypothetical protein